jgi:outer membrane protein
MQKMGLVRKSALAIGAFLTCALVAQSAVAQTRSIFPEEMPSTWRERFFMRLGYTSAFIKTKSGETYDVTGPVLSRDQLAAAFQRGIAISTPGNPLYDANSPNNDQNDGESFRLFGERLLGTNPVSDPGLLAAAGLTGLGTPKGVRAKAGNAGTPTLSLNYWLTDEYMWAVEAFVLGVPLDVKAYGDAINAEGKPMAINGKELISTKMLPAFVVLSRYFRDPKATFRPYIGLGAMYAIFFDSKASSILNTYVGGNTSVSVKNSFGVGPFAGLVANATDSWHVNLSLGQIQLKTTATLTTADTMIKTGDLVLADYQSTLAAGIRAADLPRNWAGEASGLTTALTSIAASLKGTPGNLGTFVRKTDEKFTNTIVTLSVGKSF